MKDYEDGTKALIAIILATIVGGGLAVFGKIGLTVVPPFIFTFFRFAIGTIFLIPFIGKLNRLTFKKLTELFLVSLLSVGNIFFFSFGIRFTTATISQLLYAFVPMLVAILSVFVLKSKPSSKQLVGIISGLVGMLYLIIYPIRNSHNFLSGTSLGNILIMFACLSFSLYLVFSKKLQNRYSPSTLVAAMIGTTMITSFPLGLLELREGLGWISYVQPITIISLFYVGIIGTQIFYLLNQYAIKHGGVLTASIIQYTSPPATLVWAMILLSEKITVEFVVGSVLAYLGAWLVTKT